MDSKKHGWRGGAEFVAKVDRAIQEMCDPLSPHFARTPVEVRAGMDAVRDRLVEAVAGFERATQERDELRAENAALRERLYHPCDGCPGCSSNDCPDALHVAQIDLADLSAKHAALFGRVAVLESSLREMAEKLEIGMDANPASSCDIFATLLYMHGLWMGRDLAAAKPAAQDGEEASDG